MRLKPAVNVDNFTKCFVCIEAKYVKKPFKLVTSRQTALLEVAHSDLAGFKNTASKGGKSYYITFVDDCTIYTKVYFLRSKTKAEEMFLKCKIELKNQLD